MLGSKCLLTARDIGQPAWGVKAALLEIFSEEILYLRDTLFFYRKDQRI